jgi:hypothetical protein
MSLDENDPDGLHELKSNDLPIEFVDEDEDDDEFGIMSLDENDPDGLHDDDDDDDSDDEYYKI